jgi:lipopolysaccharide export system permease protein
VAIRMSKSDYLSAFITCFLPIIVVYYPLVLGGTSLSRDGRISPIFTIWAADAVIGLAGLVIFRRLLKN